MKKWVPLFPEAFNVDDTVSGVLPEGRSILGVRSPDAFTAQGSLPTKSVTLSGLIFSSLVLGKATDLVQVICPIPIMGWV